MVQTNTIRICLKKELNQFQIMQCYKGVNSSRFSIIGLGETEPVASNETDNGKSRTEELRLQFLQMKILKLLPKEANLIKSTCYK